MQGVDANDTGQTISQPLVGSIRPMTVSGVIAAMNPAWDEELDPGRGGRALRARRSRWPRRSSSASSPASRAYRRALDLVRAAISRASDPRIIELDRKLPWHETVVTTAPEALFVIYPKSDGWSLQAVPVELGDFTNRLDLPEAWAGLSGAELAAVSGVPDAVFVHSKRFYASAGPHVTGSSRWPLWPWTGWKAGSKGGSGVPGSATALLDGTLPLASTPLRPCRRRPPAPRRRSRPDVRAPARSCPPARPARTRSRPRRWSGGA